MYQLHTHTGHAIDSAPDETSDRSHRYTRQSSHANQSTNDHRHTLPIPHPHCSTNTHCPTNQSTNDTVHQIHAPIQPPQMHTAPAPTNTRHTRSHKPTRRSPGPPTLTLTPSQHRCRRRRSPASAGNWTGQVSDRPYPDRPSTGQARHQTDRTLMSHTPDQDIHPQFNRPGIRQVVT